MKCSFKIGDKFLVRDDNDEMMLDIIYFIDKIDEEDNRVYVAWYNIVGEKESIDYFSDHVEELFSNDNWVNLRINRIKKIKHINEIYDKRAS